MMYLFCQWATGGVWRLVETCEASPGLLGISGYHIIYAKLNSKAVYKKIIGFHQKFLVEKYFLWSKIFKIWNFRSWFFENPKIEKSKMLIIYIMKFSRFSDFDFSIFRISKIMIENFRFWKFSITKNIFRPEMFDENR